MHGERASRQLHYGRTATGAGRAGAWRQQPAVLTRPPRQRCLLRLS